MRKRKSNTVLVGIRLASVLGFLYMFLVSIGLMGLAFEGFGEGFANALLTTTSNPFVGLFVGILATSIVQSSSTTTSIVVGIVGSGILTVGNAVPIIMGANIGTTVTSMMVALTNVTRREEFRRSIAGATVHDFFNLICVIIFFPLELMTGFLEKSAVFLAKVFVNSGGIKYTSPVKTMTAPTINFLESVLKDFFQLSGNFASILMVLLSFVILFISLYYIVKIMKTLIMSKAETMLDNILGTHSIWGILLGLFITIFVQSSSITVSLLVPLIAAGIVSLELVFPIVVGANIGTTTTAILASFATGNISAITIAFVHFLFNVAGTILIYPIKPIRQIPLKLAKAFGELAFRKRRYAFIYVITTFFILPSLLILVFRVFT
ncbi:MAG: Na/Pi symporter [Candidatus Margulisbacteria bacterium]|nr:Na/Pi symporter [Candidatus Margulisiibacteriota bacterium]